MSTKKSAMVKFLKKNEVRQNWTEYVKFDTPDYEHHASRYKS